VQRPAARLYENYAGPTCKTEYQMCMKSCGRNREPAVSLELEAAMKKLWKIIAAATAASISVDVSAAAAENLQKLSVFIRAKLTGMQLTDEVPLALRLRPRRHAEKYSMGTKKLANGRSRRTNSVFYLKETGR